MPFISLVVPVYQVEAYLRECLESILGQGFTDLELIAVDDCSPDRSGEILDEYAARDPRVKAIHLGANVGLGRARNIGFDAAGGEYVWFIDSDDWLAKEVLSEVAERLVEIGPDVLVVDYERTFPGTRRERNVNAHVLEQAPKAFRIGEYPALLTNFVAAWNKVVRSEFLRKTGLRFPSGWYEDIPFTYPLLARADQISVLPRVCIHYRQRRHGSILGTMSARHTQVFDQYELAMTRIEDPLVRAHVARAAVDHGSTILGIPERLPAKARRGFFQRLKDFGLRYQGFRPGIRDYLLSRGAWRTYWALKHLRQAARVPKPQTFTPRQLRRVPWLAYYWIQRRLPLQNLAVYSSYWGRAYECNPAAIHAAATRLAPHVRSVWAVSADQMDRLPPGVKGAVVHSFAYYRALARARWTFNNANFGDEVVKRPGTTHVQTHHGTPLKLMGVDEPAFRDNPEKLLKRCDRWDFSLSSNRYSSEIWARAYPCRFETLEYGYPRNDILVNATPDFIAHLRARYPEGPLVLYAPTFREAPPVPPEIGLNVLTKQHYFHGDGTATAPIEELMLVADVLVTDYSSVMFDYALLDRPIVIYAPDWERYRAWRGVYFDLLARPPGIVARAEDELNAAFASGAVWETAELRAAFRERFCQFDDGGAAERVVRRVILGERPDGPRRRPEAKRTGPAATTRAAGTTGKAATTGKAPTRGQQPGIGAARRGDGALRDGV